MRSDEEIREHAAPGTASPPVSDERLASEKECGLGHLLQDDAEISNDLVQRLDGLEGDGKFSMDHGIDEELVNLRLHPELSHRPVCPIGIVLEDINQDVRIDDQHNALQSSPRSMDISSFVRHLTCALPRADSNGSRTAPACAPAFRTTTCPS